MRGVASSRRAQPLSIASETPLSYLQKLRVEFDSRLSGLGVVGMTRYVRTFKTFEPRIVTLTLIARFSSSFCERPWPSQLS